MWNKGKPEPPYEASRRVVISLHFLTVPRILYSLSGAGAQWWIINPNSNDLFTLNDVCGPNWGQKHYLKLT